MKLFAAGISYKTAPVELREQLSVTASKLVCQGCRLKICGELDEVVLLSTCNRIEIYGTTPLLTGRIDSLFQLLTPSQTDFRSHVYLHEDIDAARHLFRVISGLDSMVLGETEITGQVKKAYESAQQSRLTGKALNRLFQKAMHVTKEIRTRTGIGRGATSVGSVAVELADKIFGNRLNQQTVIIIGAGQMGETCVRHLAKKGTKSILVSNRSFDRAEALASEFGGEAVRFDQLEAAMARADIVVSSTGCPKILLQRDAVERLMRARKNRPLFLIDISVPRNIDPSVQDLENVYLYNIDDLEQIVAQNVKARQEVIATCDDIVDRHAAAVMQRISGSTETFQSHRLQVQPEWGFQRSAVLPPVHI
jgi:glutamyl-tRNA reductase